MLRPLFRYMRNDLNRLQMWCRNKQHGCETICSLEAIDRHESECEYSRVPCLNAGCTVQVERRGLEAHMAVCECRSRECSNGCGYAMLSADDAQHNCIAELRTELELLRSEMICKVEEVKHEMESRLDSQRRHMVQKESFLQNEIEELKSQLSRVMSDMRTLVAEERKHRQEVEQAELEKRELVELLKSWNKESRLLNGEGGSKRTTAVRPPNRMESIKRKPKEVTVI
ncbi:RING finger protein 151 isoform X3 [Mobula hypostoma]